VVVDAPFVHHGGGTRTGEAAPVSMDEDLAQRRAALARFAGKWRHRLPSDVRSPRERLVDWLRRGSPRRRDPAGARGPVRSSTWGYGRRSTIRWRRTRNPVASRSALSSSALQ